MRKIKDRERKLWLGREKKPNEGKEKDRKIGKGKETHWEREIEAPGKRKRGPRKKKRT